MLASLARAVNSALGTGAATEDAAVDPAAAPVTTGVVVEVWVELGETLAAPNKVTRFAAKMVKPHACGQWLVCDWEVHEKSSNPSFKGFQKVYRKKYKPTKMKQQCFVTMNSDNGTDSQPEVWGHVMKVLNDFAEYDVFVDHEEKKPKRKNKK